MDVIKEDFITYESKFINGKRTCDGPGCTYTGLMKRYYNSLNYMLLFCDWHYNSPHEIIGQNIYNFQPPIFTLKEYKYIKSDGSFLCGYKGCAYDKNLVKWDNEYFCQRHSQELVNLELSIVCKNDPVERLITLIRSFNNRKVLSVRNISAIKKLEKLWGINRSFHSKSPINLIHYEYSYNNYILSQNIRHSEPKSEPASPTIKSRVPRKLSVSTPVYRKNYSPPSTPSSPEDSSPITFLGPIPVEPVNNKKFNKFNYELTSPLHLSSCSLYQSDPLEFALNLNFRI